MNMQCAQCRQPIPDGAAFCMHCGSARPMAMAPGVGGAATFPMATPSKRPWVLAAAILLALIGTFFLLRATGALQAFGMSTGSESLKAQGAQAGNDVLQAQGSQGSNVLSAEGSNTRVPLDATASRKRMPDDIRAWLEHLERIEKKRGELSGEQLSAAIVTMTELQLGGGLDAIKALIEDTGEGDAAPSPADTTSKEFQDYNQKWRELNDEFHSIPPPAECVPIRDAYDPALRETGTMITEIVGQMQNASADPKAAVNALTKMKGTSDGRIGVPSRKTDGFVGDICHKYDTAKWFSINSDFGAGLFGKLGL